MAKLVVSGYQVIVIYVYTLFDSEKREHSSVANKIIFYLEAHKTALIFFGKSPLRLFARHVACLLSGV